MKLNLATLACLSASVVQAASDRPSDLLNQVIKAIGGSKALAEVRGLTLQSSVFRSRTLTQSYNLNAADILVARAATQTVSYDFGSTGIKQRIDRSLAYDDFWRYAHPSLELEFSLVVQTGANAFACFNKGGNTDDPSVPFGYADRYLTDYLVYSAQQSALVAVLRQFESSRTKLKYSMTRDEVSLTEFPTLTNPQSGLSLLINNATSLPYAIRSTEAHKIYSVATNDIVFSNYGPVKFGAQTIQYPQRVQTVYNAAYIIEDVVNENITVNPQFSSDQFQPTPPKAPANLTPDPYTPHAPHTDDEYLRSEVHEFYETGIWFGPFGQSYNASFIQAAPVFPNGSVPQIMNLFIGRPDDPNYVHGLIEFEDGFLLTDAPPHRGKIILEWLKTNKPGKKVTHVAPSHHHRDHTGGVADLLAAGAKLVVPEIAKDYYKKVNNGKFETITYTADKPFIKKDKNIQFMSFWQGESPHASDWVYAVAGPLCSSKYNKSEVVVFNADVINPSPGPMISWDTAEAIPFFINAVHQGVPRQATLIGAHGFTSNGLGTQDALAHLADIAGFPYPDVIPGKRVWC